MGGLSGGYYTHYQRSYHLYMRLGLRRTFQGPYQWLVFAAEVTIIQAWVFRKDGDNVHSSQHFDQPQSSIAACHFTGIRDVSKF